jgi:hypothetical protein
MTDLSQVAKAVRDAYEGEDTYNFPLDGIAAALRAAADQLKYKLLDVEVIDCSQLLLLADELES